MLITLTCSPAHRLAPNSHWLIVLSTPSTPDLTHRGAESVGHSDVFWHTHFPVDSTERQKSQENKCYMNKGPGCRINLSSTQIRTSVNPISFYSFNKRKHHSKDTLTDCPRLAVPAGSWCLNWPLTVIVTGHGYTSAHTLQSSNLTKFHYTCLAGSHFDAQLHRCPGQVKEFIKIWSMVTKPWCNCENMELVHLRTLKWHQTHTLLLSFSLP